MPKTEIKRDRKHFSVYMTKEEYHECLKLTKQLKREYGVQRAHLLRVILTKLLVEPELIAIAHFKGGLRNKKIK